MGKSELLLDFLSISTNPPSLPPSLFLYLGVKILHLTGGKGRGFALPARPCQGPTRLLDVVDALRREGGREGGREGEVGSKGRHNSAPTLLEKKTQRIEGGRREGEGVLTWVLLAVSPMRLL